MRSDQFLKTLALEPLGCNMGHTIPATCDTTPVTGMVYTGAVLPRGFNSRTAVSMYHGILHTLCSKTAGMGVYIIIVYIITYN